jgi:hypothetical protein
LVTKANNNNYKKNKLNFKISKVKVGQRYHYQRKNPNKVEPILSFISWKGWRRGILVYCIIGRQITKVQEKKRPNQMVSWL